MTIVGLRCFKLVVLVLEAVRFKLLGICATVAFMEWQVLVEFE